MQPVLVFPMNDPNGLLFPHLQTLTPLLKALFSQAILSVPVSTRNYQSSYISWLQTEDFFDILYFDDDPPVGDAFANLYRYSAQLCEPDQLLHLSYIDRLAFILQTEHREQFIADVQALDGEQMPLIFHRSSAAWDTHPTNYREIEQMATKVGEFLYGKTLDFAWCHLVAKTSQLRPVLEQIDNQNISMVAEIVIALRDIIHTQEVDWLAWEDPFITDSDPQLLKLSRENSAQENLKRLSYVVPMLQHLYDAVQTEPVSSISS